MSGGGGDQDAGEKDHDPSSKRLEDARRKGDIPRSQDLMTAAAYAGFVLAALTLGAGSLERAGSVGAAFLGNADRWTAALMQDQPSGTTDLGRAGAPVIAAAFRMVAPLTLLLLVPAAAVLVYLFATRSLVFAPDKLMPKLSRISPLATAAQKFGASGWVEFAKSTLKLVLVSVALGRFLVLHLEEILSTVALSPAMATAVLLDLVMSFLLLVLGLSVALGALDFFWQRHDFVRRNRMSLQDLKDEYKESEGDPHAKASRRQLGREIATSRMLADVATADVVIVNPTHYAVALKWSRDRRTAPICVAKGVDEVAARIRDRATAAKVPIRSDPPTARALYATVDIGQQILPDHYRAVATSIRFAEAMRRKARRGFGG